MVRHAPLINSGRVEGSVRQLTGEDVALNGGAAITGALLVPGTPQVRLNGHPTFGGVVEGSGSAQPSGYRVTLNGNATLGRLITRTDPIPLSAVAAPPPTTGTVDILITLPGQLPRDYKFVRDLTVNGDVGLVPVPPGTYRNFTSNGGSGFVFGVPGSAAPAVYNLNRLTLNGNARLEIVGPVVLTLATSVSLNGPVGASTNPLWLTLKVAAGGVNLNGGSSLYAKVQVPSGTVTLNGNALLQGSVACDRLSVNGNSLLKGVAGEEPSLESVSPASATQGQTLEVTLRGRDTRWAQGQTRASFGGEISVGGAAPGELGPVSVVNSTTALAQVTVSATAALAPRTVRVETSGASEVESETLLDAFVVGALSPPGSSASRVSTLAGVAGSPGFADGPAAQARFRDPSGIAVAPGEVVYVADSGNHRIRRIAPDGAVTTLAGDGVAGFADGASAAARFDSPQGVAVGGFGMVYVADAGNHRIRRIAPDGTATTLAGDGTAGFRDGQGSQARFNAPRGVAVDGGGNLYIADTGNSAVRVITPAGEVRTVAGDGTIGASDSPNARFNGLAGLTVDGTTVFIYLADTGNHRIRRLDPSGAVMTIAGAERGFADGAAAQARFAEPVGITMDGAGQIVVADTINSLVRLVEPARAVNGEPAAVTTLAGTGGRGFADGAGDQARFFSPRGIAVAESSAIVVADTGNHVLRRMLLPPTITAIAPARARVGEAVVIEGGRFDGRGPDRNVIRFARAGGGQTVAQVTAATRTQLTAVVPTDAATGPVTVQTEGGTAASPADFEVITASPVIADFMPKRGPVGTVVTLTGTALKVDANNPTVTFAGGSGARLPALVTLATPTEVRATVPNAAVTGPIELTNAVGRAITADSFTVEAQQDFQLTIAPSATTAPQGGTGTYVVYVTSAQPTFTQLARLSATSLPSGVTASFNPQQITAGASSTLSLVLPGTLAPSSYSFTVRAAADVEGRELDRTATATVNVMAAGQTTLAGRVLSMQNEPIMSATVSLDGKSASTDAAGSFLLSGVTAGVDRPVMIDGRTASAPNRTYPVITEPATIIAGQANVVPFTFYLPAIDTQYEVPVIPNQDTVVTTPKVPGIVVTIPAGANLRNRDGTPVARVSITPVDIDRTPAPLPPNVNIGLVYTVQPGGAVADVAMPVIYPNLLRANPGTRVELYAFNHDTVRWYVYGYGRISQDGRLIVPEIDPATGRPYGLRDFSWYGPARPQPPPTPENPNPNDCPSPPPGVQFCCPTGRTGAPVDLSTGLKIETMTDISFGGARGGLSLTRTYTTGLAVNRFTGRFGLGTRDNYDIRLADAFAMGGAGRVLMPEEGTGRLFSFAETATDGALVFKTTASIKQLGDVVRKLSNGTFEYRYARGDVMRFDSAGRLIAMVDRNGNTTTLTYAGSNLTSITDPVGRSIMFNYNGSRVSSATDPLGRVWRYDYDGTGRLTTVTDPLGATTRYEYDNFNRLTSVTDKRGTLAKQITYDGGGRVSEQRFADGGFERYAYTLSGLVITGATVTDSLGRAESKRFADGGYVLGTTDALGQSSVIERDVTTRLPLTVKGPCGCPEDRRKFDARGNPVEVTDRLDQTAKYEYDPVFNHITKMTDRLGRMTIYGYDTFGNLKSVTDALNQTTRYEYDDFGQMTAVIDPLNHATRIEYDQYGNLKARVDALGNRTEMEYDAVGRLITTADPMGRRASLTYDELDRVISATDPSDSVTRFAYDANGNQVSMTDALGRTWASVYDVKNRLIARIDPLSRMSRMEYDSEDQMTAMISPSGRTVHYGYDARGQRTMMTDGMGGTVRFTYDNRKNLTTLTDQRGNTTTFAYDELFRPAGRRDPLGLTTRMEYDAEGDVKQITDRLGRPTLIDYDELNRRKRVTYVDAIVTYNYDEGGRLKRVDDTQSGPIEWAYDDANRRLSEQTPAGLVSYDYNKASQRLSMTAADRPPVNYDYDSAGRLRTIMQGTEVFTYDYDTLSRLTSLQRPNGVKTDYRYDAVNRMEQLTHTNAFGNLIEDFRYIYNADDEVASITPLVTSQLLATAKTISTADAANRIAQFGQSSYSFDSEGQITTKTDTQGTISYAWDARGRLMQVRLPSGQTVSYKYDTLGRRGNRIAGGVTTSFLYDGDDIVLDKGSDGRIVDYLNGLDTDQKLRQEGATTDGLYFLHDYLGSTTVLTGSVGNVVERLQYEVFGESAGTALTRYDYTGRERDVTTGLLNYRARWYDQQQGRFISEDPIGFEGGYNLYTYANNSPTSFVDPSGLDFAAPHPICKRKRGLPFCFDTTHKKCHNDLEEACRNCFRIPDHVDWLSESIKTRAAELPTLPPNQQSGHGHRLDAERKKLAECIKKLRECSKGEKVPAPNPDVCELLIGGRVQPRPVFPRFSP